MRWRFLDQSARNACLLNAALVWVFWFPHAASLKGSLLWPKTFCLIQVFSSSSSSSSNDTPHREEAACEILLGPSRQSTGRVQAENREQRTGFNAGIVRPRHPGLLPSKQRKQRSDR